MLRQIVGRSLKRTASLMSLSRRARIVACILPARFWYRFALFASRVHGQLKARSGGNGALTEALMLDNWMRELTFSGAYFIPWQPGQMDILSQIKPGHGILYCWTHVPLVEMPLHVLLELGHTVDLIVANPGKIENGNEFVVPGLKTRLKAISVDRRVLTKVRTALAEGKSVACLADAEIFGPLSSQVLRVAGMVSAFVIFQWAERQADGSLLVTFIPAPYPLCANDQEIDENLEFLRRMNKKTLGKLGALPYGDSPHTPEP